MRIVIAPDKFKGSLSAADVVAEVAAGLTTAGLVAEIIGVPMADGGEGTVDAALGAGYRAASVEVSGPVGNPVSATIAIDDRTATAVIEMAAASGLGVLPVDARGRIQRDPLGSSSLGTGQLITAALDAGCRRIVLGVGGSANTDGGAGLLAGLGVRFLDAAGESIPGGGGGLSRLAAIDITGLDQRLPETELILAADVTNPLLGAAGAASVFGPQKGASPAQVRLLDDNLTQLVTALSGPFGDLAQTAAGQPGAGAAGGVGFAALLLGATRRAGIDVVIDLVDLDSMVAGADVVITGEGSLDDQSLGGKTPLGVAARARAHQVPTVLAVCGRTTLSPDQRSGAGFDRVWALTDIESRVSVCINQAGPLLRRLSHQLADFLR